MREKENFELQKLGKKLRDLRQLKDLSQESFAELTNLDRTYISGLERGKRNPSFKIFVIRETSTLLISPYINLD